MPALLFLEMDVNSYTILKKGRKFVQYDHVPETTLNILYGINEILSQYIVIHDVFFDFRWERALPIPGVFESMDFREYSRNLDSLSAKLDSIISSVQDNDDLSVLIREYSAALNETINLLKDICVNLHNKAEAIDRGYTWDKYNQDRLQYEKSAKEYQNIGLRLNMQLQKM
ncbi:hypothetical protein ACFL45_09530 [Candidatus Neomarinimicrobiota bacterium]